MRDQHSAPLVQFAGEQSWRKSPVPTSGSYADFAHLRFAAQVDVDLPTFKVHVKCFVIPAPRSQEI
ncbi:hypothetical protein ACNKHK_12350 [Shigella flexneri]